VPDDRPMWIDNTHVAPAEGAWIDSEDPATEEVLGRVPAGTAADVDRAVAAASRAWDGWRYTAANDRAELLHEAVARSFDHHEELVELLTREQGKARPEQEEEAEWALTSLRYYAELGRNGLGRVIPPVNRARSSTSCSRSRTASSARSCPGTTPCCC
jgi:betaine-aldehyde dehydrogenase